MHDSDLNLDQFGVSNVLDNGDEKVDEVDELTYQSDNSESYQERENFEEFESKEDYVAGAEGEADESSKKIDDLSFEDDMLIDDDDQLYGRNYKFENNNDSVSNT